MDNRCGSCLLNLDDRSILPYFSSLSMVAILGCESHSQAGSVWFFLHLMSVCIYNFLFSYKKIWAKLWQLFLFLFCKHKKPINDARHAWDSFGRMPNKIRAINSCTLIADICHFSPQVQFLAKFVSTQNWINRDKIGFASKQRKSQKTA